MTCSADSNLRDLTRFYGLLSQLETKSLQGADLSTVIAGALLPARGVYFFQEPDQHLDQRALKGIEQLRITRVGTHAVSAGSKSTLRARLKAHLGSKVGSGNHRGSIFRLHIGSALLRLDGKELPTWGLGSVAPQVLRDSEAAQAEEAALERRVSSLIGAMRVFWVDVPDDPGPASERLTIERGAIALLSNQLAPHCSPSAQWLGSRSARHEIRNSGLWNLRHVQDPSNPAFLDNLERAVIRTIGG